MNLDAPDLAEQLDLWQFFFSCHRLHGGLNGKTHQSIAAGSYFSKTASSEELDCFYDPSKEQLRVADYGADMRLVKLKASL